MRYYPAFLDLQGKPCVVVGGGAIAWRKAKSFLACGARVTVISPDAVKPLQALSRRRRIVWQRRRFRPGDADRAFVIVAATDDQTVNRAVFARAAARQRLVNVVDQPARCTFIVPSIMSRGALTMAISTGGASPALSKWLRRDLAARYGATFPKILERMRGHRAAVHAQTAAPRARKRQLETLLQDELRRAGVKAR